MASITGYTQTKADELLGAKANTSDLGTAATASVGDFATAAQGSKADASDVAAITLTAPLALTIPAGFPAGQVYRVTLTQDGTGGHAVTYGGNPVTVDLTAGASTTVELHPVGGGYVVRYPDPIGRDPLDLRSFLLPGEAFPDDGVLDAAPLIRRAVGAVSAAAATDGPRAIRVPAGRYRMLTSVVWKTGAGLMGSGRTNTIFLPEGQAQLASTASNNYGSTLDDCIFSDFTVDCSGQDSTDTTATIKAFSVRWLKRARFERVTVLNSWATAFGCDFMQDSTYVDCVSVGAGRGLTTPKWGMGAGFGIGVGAWETESVRFVNCEAYNSRSGGFFFERLAIIPWAPQDGRGITLVGCTARGNYAGLSDAGAHGLRAIGCHFTNNHAAGVVLSGSAENGSPRSGGKDGLIENCVIRKNGGVGGAGIYLRHAASGGYAFEGNDVTDNTGPGVWAPETSVLGTGFRFDGNSIARNSGGGIIIDAKLIDRIEIAENRVERNGADGIRLGGYAVAPRIVGNKVTGHHLGTGILLAGAANTAAAPVIKRNIVIENGAAIVNEQVTVDVTGITDNSVSVAITTITNEVKNPSVEVDAAGFAVNGNVTTPTRVVSDAPAGTAYATCTTIAASGSSLRAASVTSAALGGEVWTYSAYVRVPLNRIIKPFIRAYGVNGYGATLYAGGIRSEADWQRVSITVALPPQANRLDFMIGVDLPLAGDVIDVDGVMLTKGVTLWPYFDGDSAGAAWSGTAHASTSVLTL